MEEKRPRGRPRPQETVDRDKAVFAYLKKHGPLSRNQIAEALELDKVKVYLSLDRLRRGDRVKICSDTAGPGAVWSTEVDAPCPG
jgi:predicted ArsR family transcriptional regulator